MMKYKLIACDMDETLLNDDKQISKENYEAIKKVRDLGVKFVLASGRGFIDIQNTAKLLNLYDKENEYIISFNGGVITENKANKLLSVEGITFEQTKALFNLGLDYNVGFHIYTIEEVYTYRISKEEHDYMKGRLDRCIALSKPDLDFLKNQQIMKVIFQNDDRNYLEKIEQEIPASIMSQFTISYSGNRYIEFNQQGVSKGSGLNKLIKQLNITSEETIAIGDNNNDISMIKAAGLGIAVANATTDTKAVANKICQFTNNQSAIAHIIEQYFN